MLSSCAEHGLCEGIRLLDGPITDDLEAQAYHIGFHLNDIYSCSWGPSDDGMTIDGPRQLTEVSYHIFLRCWVIFN